MHNRIDRTFEDLRKKNSRALVAYITGGDPDLEKSFEIARKIHEAGADLLEIGIPFSDPLADGPTIQAAAGRAIASGTTVPRLLEHLKIFRSTCEMPVVLFTYLNPVYVYGYERFFRDAAAAGADGVLILDLPPDEAERNAELSRASGLQSIRLIAPTTPESRIASICKHAEGFIYYVSREGVTGEQMQIADSVQEKVSLIRRHTTLPIAVGFGISNPEQASKVAKMADGAVVGSAIVRRIADAAAEKDLPDQIRDFVTPLARAVHSAGGR